MKVLVTGAGGRIGTHLSRALLAEGHEVRAFGLHDDPRLLALEPAGAQIFTGDLEAPQTLAAAADHVDVVCHLAAALTTHDVSDDRFVDVNLRGTFNLLEAVRQFAPDIRRVIYTSSDAVYWAAAADAQPAAVIDEDSPLKPVSVYGATKVGAEMLCRAYWRTYGIPYTVMRPTATADPHEFANPASVFGRRWFVSAAIGWYERHPRSASEHDLLTKLRAIDDGTPKLYALVNPDGSSNLATLADARDAAAGMRAMIEPAAAVGEVFNIGPAATHSHREFVEYLGQRLGAEVVEVRHEEARGNWNISSAKAARLLGYRPVRDVFAMIDEAVAGSPRPVQIASAERNAS
jgi:nucleoside-diphosphate-sugar epimerase